MGRKRRWWSKRAKKESERRERELAEKKAKDRSDSEHRQEEIKVLWSLDDEQPRTTKNLKARELKRKQLKAQKLKQLLRSVEDLTGHDDIVDQVRELVRLVALQDREIEYLMRFRRDWEEIEAHYPGQLENLYTARVFDQIRLSVGKLPAEVKP